MISIGQGYLTKQILYIKFEIVTTFLLHCIILNYPVMGFIIVTAFNMKKISFPTYVVGTIIYTHSLLQGILYLTYQ